MQSDTIVSYGSVSFRYQSLYPCNLSDGSVFFWYRPGGIYRFIYMFTFTCIYKWISFSIIDYEQTIDAWRRSSSWKHLGLVSLVWVKVVTILERVALIILIKVEVLMFLQRLKMVSLI